MVTNYGEGDLQEERVGEVKFYPCKEEAGGDAKQVLAMLKAGHTQF